MDKLLQPLLELPAFTVYLLIGLLCWSEGAFFLGFVTPGLVAGWAAPSGIALGVALGMAWAITLELLGTALRSESPASEGEQGDSASQRTSEYPPQ